MDFLENVGNVSGSVNVGQLRGGNVSGNYGLLL